LLKIKGVAVQRFVYFAQAATATIVSQKHLRHSDF